MSKILRGVNLFGAVAGLCLFTSPVISAAWQQSTGSAYECTQVSLDEIDPALLTKEERIALLDNSLSDSIDQFSSCVSSVQQQSASGQGQGSGAGQGQGQSAGEAGLEGQQASEGEQSGEGQSAQEMPEMSGQPADQSLPQAGQTPNTSNSSTPSQRGVIPPKDNDKIICKLLYDEITKTTNADMLKGLKEQYTNYKCG